MAAWVRDEPMSTEERVTELEIRSAHLEQLLSELSEVLYRQQKELDGLRSAVEKVKDRVKGDPGLVDAAMNDWPPHY